MVGLVASLIVPVRLVATVAVGVTIFVRWGKEILANSEIIQSRVDLAFENCVFLHYNDVGNGGFLTIASGCCGSSRSSCALA